MVTCVTRNHAVENLAGLSPDEIAGAAQTFWDLMADSYREYLWGASYLINGGASDDGFEYFAPTSPASPSSFWT